MCSPQCQFVREPEKLQGEQAPQRRWRGLPLFGMIKDSASGTRNEWIDAEKGRLVSRKTSD